MSRFEILQIGEDIEPSTGIPEGCDLCGHCRMLRRASPDGPGPACGGGLALEVRREGRTGAPRPGRSDRGAN